METLTGGIPDTVQIFATNDTAAVLVGLLEPYLEEALPIVYFADGRGFQRPSLGEFSSGQINGITADGSIYVGGLRGAGVIDTAVRWTALGRLHAGGCKCRVERRPSDRRNRIARGPPGGLGAAPASAVKGTASGHDAKHAPTRADIEHARAADALTVAVACAHHGLLA